MDNRDNQIFLGDDSLKFCYKGFGMGTKNEALWLANDLWERWLYGMHMSRIFKGGMHS